MMTLLILFFLQDDVNLQENLTLGLTKREFQWTLETNSNFYEIKYNLFSVTNDTCYSWKDKKLRNLVSCAAYFRNDTCFKMVYVHYYDKMEYDVIKESLDKEEKKIKENLWQSRINIYDKYEPLYYQLERNDDKYTLSVFIERLK